MPSPGPDLIEYIENLVLLYSDSAVLREQCRAALQQYSATAEQRN